MRVKFPQLIDSPEFKFVQDLVILFAVILNAESVCEIFILVTDA